MAEATRMTTADVVASVMAGEHGDFVREAVALVARELMEAEISVEVGAELGEVSAERSSHRNGYRPRPWETRVGEIELLIPRKRQGPAYFPSFLEPRRRSEQAIVAVVLEAYVNGVSTRKVDRLVEQLGIAGMTKDRVSALCRGLDEQVRIFRERPLEGAYPYLWLDAKHVKVRSGGHVRSKALVIAYAVHESGVREVIGLDLGEVESEAFWVEFLRSLRARGLRGVRLAISDHHEGLKHAIERVLACPWQRCSVHFVRNMHQHCRPSQRGLVSAALRELFTAEDGKQARERMTQVLERLQPTVGKVCELLEDAEEDLLAFYAFPGSALAEAPQHKPARAGQPRDRPPLRRRRHLPERHIRDPPRWSAADRAERRVAGVPALPLRREHEPPRRCQRQPRSPTRRKRRGGHRAQRRLSHQRPHRRTGVTPLHTT
jgi:putative transposase